MNPLKLLIALVILLGLGGAVWYSEKHPPEPKSDIKREKILAVEQDKLKSVRIFRLGADPVVLEKADDGKWSITGPKAYKADESAVTSLTSSLTTLNADDVLAPNNTDWKTYGLDPPRMIVQVTLADGKEHKLNFGEDAPISAATYARLEGDPRLFTVATAVKTGFDKSASDLRDKRVLPFDSEKASRVTITTKEQTLEFGKSGTNWQILKPKPVRTENFAVDDVIRSVRDANLESVLDESEKPSPKYSFASPYAVFEAVDPAGVHTLTVAKDAKDNSYYVKTTAMAGVYKIASTVAEGLHKEVDDLRNKKLFDFGFTDPQKLEVRDGDTRLTIEKKADKWVRADAGGKELPSDKVQSLIDNLRNLSAKAFTADDAPAQAKYGLDKPPAEAKVTSDEGKRVETVVFAPSASGQCYAARQGEPGTYEVEKASCDEFQKAIEALK